MKIVGLQNNGFPLGKEIMQHREETLIVEMTQEEYQRICALLYCDELNNEIEDDKQNSIR